MEDKIHTPAGNTELQSEGNHWAIYPQNVHQMTVGGGGGLSLETKRGLLVLALIGLSVVITFVGIYIGSKFGLTLLGFLTGVVGGIILSIYLYYLLGRDKLNEEFESDSGNKILKLFRIRITDLNSNTEKIGKADLMSYTNGEVFITLRIEIGNSNEVTEAVTAEFLDSLFKSAHQLQLKVKNYNTRHHFKKSNVRHEHLKRLTKVDDNKLKQTLASIDNHQSDIFAKSKVMALHFIFYTRANNSYALEALNAFVEDWIETSKTSSSIRTIDWLDKQEVIDSICDFLSIDHLDLASDMNKKNISYDTRRIVRVYSSKRFNPRKDINIEVNATPIRKARGG